MTFRIRLLQCLLFGGLAASCSGTHAGVEQEGAPHSEAFLMVAREDGESSGQALVQALGEAARPAVESSVTNENFYVAIHKSQLNERFFVSTYLTQFYPSPWVPGATSIGTRVVKFSVQNGQVVLIDADDRKKLSETFDPKVIVDAYPIVEDFKPFKKVPGYKDYVLFNPAAGRNEFSLFGYGYSNWLAYGSQEGVGEAVKVHSTFLQRFRPLADGASFEKVFAGTTPAWVWDWASGWYTKDIGTIENWAGTVSMSIRKYQEGEGFVESAPPEGTSHYFVGMPKWTPNTGEQTAPLAKWNIHKGMKPLKWVISDKIAFSQQDERFKDLDLEGAIKRGIEGWNQAFGFQVVEAVVGTEEDSQGDNEKNYLVWDTNPALGYAYADWRVNPNTGELLGASVYMNAGWLDYADSIFTDPSEQPAAATKTAVARMKKNARLLDANKSRVVRKTAHGAKALYNPAAPPQRQLGVSGSAGGHLCMRSVADALSHSASVGAKALTKKEKMEKYITHIVLHEVGHTFGLRHNFKGSLVPPSSSVMDYVYDQDAVMVDVPGAYDVAAVKYLYGLSTELPTQPFCTDEGVFSMPPGSMDVECMPFDKGRDPLKEMYVPALTANVKKYLEDSARDPWDIWDFYVEVWGAQNYLMTDAARADRMDALNALTQYVKPPVAAEKLAIPGYKEKLEVLTTVMYHWLFFGPAEYDPYYGLYYLRPTLTDDKMNAELIGQMKAIAMNTDGARSMFDRSAMIWNGFKNYQSDAGLQALIDVRSSFNAAKASAQPAEANNLDQLIKYVDLATNPYRYPMSY